MFEPDLWRLLQWLLRAFQKLWNHSTAYKGDGIFMPFEALFLNAKSSGLKLSNVEGNGMCVETTSRFLSFRFSLFTVQNCSPTTRFPSSINRGFPLLRKTHIHFFFSIFFFSKVLGCFAHKRAYLLVLISSVLSEKSLRTVIFHISRI